MAEHQPHTYTYGDAQWRDLLTAFDGQSITYSGGNPTSYYNGTRWKLYWKEGNHLYTALTTGEIVSFDYDLNGVRMSKSTNYLKAFLESSIPTVMRRSSPELIWTGADIDCCSGIHRFIYLAEDGFSRLSTAKVGFV